MGLTARFRRSALTILAGLLFATLLAACGISSLDLTPTPAPNPPDLDIDSQFLDFAGQYGGGSIFGQPLADSYRDGGRRVQYFERLRLEYDLVDGQVLVAPLGEWALPAAEFQRPAPVSEDSPVRTFAESGQTVRDEFLAFYEAHDGEVLFGPPISAQLDEGDLRVQYFRNARLEWHPEAALERRIQVGLLGKAHYRAQGFYEDPGRSRPVPGLGLEDVVVNAVFRTPILYTGDRQAIFVTVETPGSRRPVAEMLVVLTVTYNGQTEVFALPETDGEGRTQGQLVLPGADPGQKVQVVVTASVPGGGVIGATSVSYKTWW